MPAPDTSDALILFMRILRVTATEEQVEQALAVLNRLDEMFARGVYKGRAPEQNRHDLAFVRHIFANPAEPIAQGALQRVIDRIMTTKAKSRTVWDLLRTPLDKRVPTAKPRKRKAARTSHALVR